MSYRIQCAACGKVMTLEDDLAGERLVCVACGTRLEAPPPPIVQAREPEGEADAGAAAVNAMTASGGRAGAQAAARRPGMGSRTTTILTAAAVSFAVVAIAGLVVALLVSRGRSGGRAGTSKEMRENADLLALKSEAESLAINGQLAEAHEKYRRLQQLAVGRDIKDPLLWDIMDRAKLDQDNVYMLLLRKQVPPGESMDATAPPPLAGTDAADPSEEEAPQPQQGEAPEDATAMAEGGEGAAGDEAPSTQEAAATQPEGPTLVAHIPPADTVTDEQIGEAMKRGVDFLLARMKDGQLADGPGMNGVKRDGMNALCVYALLTSGQAMNDERLDVRGDLMKGMIEKMKSHDFKSRRGDPQQPVTYARSLRAAALAVHNRNEDRKVLKEDVDWLVAAAVNGAYTYDDQLTRNYTAAKDRRADEAEDAAFDEEALGETTDDRAMVAAGQLTGMAGAAGTLSGDTSVEVFPMHGIHDSKGRELYVPLRLPGGRTPLRGTYPQRPIGPTRPPGTGRPTLPQQRTGIPGDWYRGNRRGMTEGPDQTPGRDGAGAGTGSLSSPFPWDNSNSQYGLLGVWSGAEVGVEVPLRYWKDVERHWTGSQLSGGEWGYLARDRSGYFAMTCGGVASLFVTHDWLAAPALKDGVGREPLTPALAQGLAWLERGDNAVNTPNPKTHYVGYDLYGLERVALASGFKYFGKHDWYRELSANALGMQWPTGAWGREDDGPDAIVDTAYTLLFLARGRHPILMNKLRFERSEVARVDGKPAPGFWANRPRDVANLTRFASRQLEKGLNWQVVSLEAPPHEWLDSPVLYIASHQAPALADGDYEKLRQYVEAGGMLFTHADTGAAPFNRWVTKLAENVAPGRPLEDLPDDHVLYDVNYKIKAPRPKLQAISNGSRLLLVHSPSDLGAQWQQRADKASAETFRLGLNLALYASGRAAFRNRLDTPNVPAPKNDPIGSVKVARVKYDGNWDPEPGAWPRFGRLFQWQTRFATEVTPVDLASLKDAGAPVAHLTGTDAYKFTDADVAAVKAYVEGGGVLLVDTCGGCNPFRESVEDSLLSRAFPGVDGTPVAPEHPLLKPDPQVEPLVPKARPYAQTAFQDGVPQVKLLKAGKGHVVLSPLDLTSGLLATNAWGIAGYDPATSQALVRNLLMWRTGRGDGDEGTMTASQSA